MPNPTPKNRTFDLTGLESPLTEKLKDFSNLELAQVLAQRLAITEKDWHRLKSNRQARAGEQAAAALVWLLNANPEEALPRFQQVVGWLEGSITAPPCPTHGQQKSIQLDEGNSVE